MAKRLEQRFGSRVRCVFVDVTSQDMNRYPEIRKSIQSRRLTLPVVAVNGQMRFVATFSPQMIVREVEQRLGSIS